MSHKETGNISYSDIIKAVKLSFLFQVKAKTIKNFQLTK